MLSFKAMVLPVDGSIRPNSFNAVLVVGPLGQHNADVAELDVRSSCRGVVRRYLATPFGKADNADSVEKIEVLHRESSRADGLLCFAANANAHPRRPVVRR